MKKLLVTLIISFSLLISMSIRSYAVNALPSSGSYAPGQSINISLIATPQAGENAVTIRINAANLTINSFTPTTGGAWVGNIAECPGSTSFTSSQICVSLAKSSDITSNEVLGTLNVTFGNSGSATLTTTSGNQYSDGSVTRASTGVVGNYTISSTAPTSAPPVLPNTSLTDYSNVFIVLSLALIFTGSTVFLVRYKI